LWLPGSRADIPEILRALNCFVLPSLAEGTSCTLQEAMATGLPIVATDVGGNADLLEDGLHGCLVPSNNPEQLADAISVAVRQPQAIRTATRQAVMQRYGAEVLIRRYQALFGLS
jgi:glycosyltransferase involved in cell wall biosynthesis